MRINKKAEDHRKDSFVRLAGGYGPHAAVQGAAALLRRSVMANLLWENVAYEDGVSVVDNIKALIPQVDPHQVFSIAIEARLKQKLRHVPLLIAREMARHDTHKGLVSELLPHIITRADQLTEFMALYWQDGKCPVSKQVKLGLANAFENFNEYAFAKYDRNTEIKLRDVMFLVHPRPPQGKEELYKKLAEGTLAVPDTWEVSLSAGKDKKETWERLINERKLGALAFMRNLRNFGEAKVDSKVILNGFETINPGWLLPINYIAAAKAAPKWEREIETLMFRGFEQLPKLSGYSIFVVDVSGSMDCALSAKSDFTRIDVACAMTMLAAEMCSRISVYVTAGSDGARQHKTEFVKPRRGFALADDIKDTYNHMGGGGIFTRQCLEYIKKFETDVPDRIIIFSDSQDCDWPHKRTPAPFGVKNYIIDVSANSRGINYAGLWDAEISGWSEHFMSYIAAFESEPTQ